MRTHLFLPTLAAFLASVCIGRSAITNVTYDSTSPSSLYCYASVTYDLVNSSAIVLMDGYQYEAGVLAGTIFADTPSDPSLTIGGSVDNDTGFAWSGYQIRIFMDRPFTLSNVGVGPVPGDWTFTTTGPAPGGSPTYYSGTQYEAEIHYAGGTPVPVGGELDFSYKLTFVGSTQYGFTTEMTPVPEPSILALGAFAMAGLCAIKRARQSSSAKQ